MGPPHPKAPQLWNRYVHNMGDPVNHVDPNGLAPVGEGLPSYSAKRGFLRVTALVDGDLPPRFLKHTMWQRNVGLNPIQAVLGAKAVELPPATEAIARDCIRNQ
jgi:hypothetical protein